MGVIKPQVLLCILAVLLISSCTSHKNGDPKTHVVEIKQMSFVPKKLTVSSGDTVKWVNLDLVTHNVSFQDRKSPKLEQGEQFAIVVHDNAEYRCSLHPVMEGQILIKN